MRPLLLPAVRRLWRDRSTLQLGSPSSRALVLAGLDATGRHVLSLMDGSRSREQLLTEPGGRPLLELLEGAGLVVDADDVTAGLRGLDQQERDRLQPDAGSLSLVRGPAATPALRARRTATVLVRGAGRVGGPLAALLAGAGVGTVLIRDAGLTRAQDTAVGGLSPRDIGRRRDQALSERLLRPASDRAGGYEQPDFVVLAGSSPDDAATAALLVAGGTPHLLVDVAGLTATVGPLVLPGRAACLRCTELTRTDLDPGWPALSAQLSGPSKADPACDGVLAVAAAAQAAAQVLEHLEHGEPATLGGTLELELPGWRWRRRSWPVHPACGCAWAAMRRAG